MKQKIAKLVRVISVPPFVIAALLLSLRFGYPAMFPSVLSLVLSFVFLAVIPVLAYPVSFAIPALRKKGREGQRNLSFAFTVVGYVAGAVFSFFFGTSPLIFLFAVYLLSVLGLLVCNRILRFRASGHAASITGPILLSAWFLGWIPVVIGIVLWGLVFWSSLCTRRHTVPEFLVGTLVAIAAFLVSLPVLFFL